MTELGEQSNKSINGDLGKVLKKGRRQGKTLEAENKTTLPKLTKDIKKVMGGTTEVMQKNLTLTETETGDQRTQPLVLPPLSEQLKREQSNSIQLLNDTSKHLMLLAKQSAQPKVAMDTGEILIKAHSHDVDTAIRCLAELRNVMKTKLDYLRFSNELVNGKATK